MTLDELLLTVESSTGDDWQRVNQRVIYDWEHIETGGEEFVRPKSFSSMAVLKQDVDISLIWGATGDGLFQDKWVQEFHSASATAHAVFLRYRGVILHKWDFVSVDGGRYIVPTPRIVAPGKFELSREFLPIGRLMFALDQCSGNLLTVEDVLGRGQVAIV